jgi:HrpA-like RNA helicase
LDSGRVKQMCYDDKKRMKQLVETWVDKASMRQRRGR